jgi:hypothetical protein
MKKTFGRVMATVLALGLAASFAQASAPKTDAELLVGSWKAIEGTYSDGSTEKELDMRFTFTKTNLSNPMGKGTSTYTVDEKQKAISAKSADATTSISYAFVNADTLDFSSLTVTSKGKTMSIIGKSDDAAFAKVRLARVK